MSERYFSIREIPKPYEADLEFYIIAAAVITESELKKRLDHAWGAASKFAPSDTWDWDKAIEILLHGKEQRKKGKSRLVYDKETRTIKAVYTDGSKPTRKEWEEWVESFVEFSGFGLSRVGLQNLTEIMLSMPIVPKKEE